jgi:tripeptide aminopeptidase
VYVLRLQRHDHSGQHEQEQDAPRHRAIVVGKELSAGLKPALLAVRKEAGALAPAPRWAHSRELSGKIPRMNHRVAEASRRLALAVWAVAGALVCTPVWAQQAAGDAAARLAATPEIAAALKAVQSREPALIEEQIRICEVAAPPFKEQRRAEAVKRIFEQLKLQNVRIDKEGNVLGERAGRGPRPHLVLAAHLDTVFPEETDVTVTREGSVLKGPGIGDDCRGLAVMIGVARLLQDTRIDTPGSITFVGDVGEEGLGDLRGVKHLFNVELKGKIDRFVSIDGTGLGVTHVGVGSKRYRMTFKGPGGHSFGAFGLANPIHALGRAAATISDLQVPATPKTTFNVGRIGGGTSVNSIAFEAWMEVDMRSSDASSLAEIDRQINAAVDAAIVAENQRWSKTNQVTAQKELVGDRPAVRTATDAPIVQTALSVAKALGFESPLGEGSTDSNLPMSLGIPAITISGGGAGRNAHALDESFDTTDSWKGTQRALLLTIALAQP